MDKLEPDKMVQNLRLNDIGRVKFKTMNPLPIDPYSVNRGMGRLILIDEATNATVGAAMICDQNLK
jgi:bifunctional enzyme CysN/CysC